MRTVITLASIALCLLVSWTLFGCDSVGLERRDNGLIDCPKSLPWHVVCDRSCSNINGTWFEDGLVWWNNRLPGTFVMLGQNDDVFEDRLANNTEATIFATVNTLPADLDWGGNVLSDDGGTVVLEWDDEGISRAFITLNYTYAYDENMMNKTWIHELGHPIGFEDDMGPPRTVTLGSIMGDPTPDDGDLLESDRDLYLSTCNP